MPPADTPVGHFKTAEPGRAGVPLADAFPGDHSVLRQPRAVDPATQAGREPPLRHGCVHRLKAALQRRRGGPATGRVAPSAITPGPGASQLASAAATVATRTTTATSTMATTTALTAAGMVAVEGGVDGAAPQPPPRVAVVEPAVSSTARFKDDTSPGESGSAMGPSATFVQSRPAEDCTLPHNPAHNPAQDSGRHSSRSVGLTALLQSPSLAAGPPAGSNETARPSCRVAGAPSSLDGGEGTDLATSRYSRAASNGVDGRSRTGNSNMTAIGYGEVNEGIGNVMVDTEDKVDAYDNLESQSDDVPQPNAASPRFPAAPESLPTIEASPSPSLRLPVSPLPDPDPDRDAHPPAADVPSYAPAEPRSSSRRTVFRLAARTLQQQTSLQRPRPVHTAAARAQQQQQQTETTCELFQWHDYGVAVGPDQEQGQGQECDQAPGQPGEWQQVKAHAAVRTDAGLRVVHMAREACNPAAASRRTASPAFTHQHRLGRQHTPLMLQRLRTGNASGSFGRLDFPDSGGYTVVAATVPLLPLQPCNTAASNQALLAPPTVASSSASGLEPLARLVDANALSKSPGGGQGGERGRHARFMTAGVGDGDSSPRTMAPALLARQQTPCPLRWAATQWWTGEDSGDALTEVAGRCWAEVAPAEEVTGAAARHRPVGLREDTDGDEVVGMDLADVEDLGASAPWVARVLVRGSSLPTTGHVQSRLGSPAPQPHPHHLRDQAVGSAPISPHPHPHPRTLRVQLSLSKLRRPSVSSVLNMVEPDGEQQQLTTTTMGSFSVVVRTPYGGGRYGGGGGGGAITPTRRGRRRNLAGNEDMVWDQMPLPRSSTPGQAGAVDQAAAGGNSPLTVPTAAGSLEDEGGRRARSRLPGPNGGSHASFAVEAPTPQQQQLQLQELAKSLGQPQSLLLLLHRGELELAGSPLPPQQSKPSPLVRPSPPDPNPIRAVCLRASSACSSTAYLPDVRPPSPCRAPRLVSLQATEEFKNDSGSPADITAVSPTSTRPGSSVSRLVFPPHLLAATADSRVAGNRATQSSDGRAGSLLGPCRASGAAAAGASRAGISCLGLLRTASVSDMAALAGPGAGCCAAAAARQGRRALYHTGSVRSHAPTEDDSAESLAKLGSEYGYGSDKALEFAASMEDINVSTVWGPGLPSPWGRMGAAEGREGLAPDEAGLQAQKGLVGAGGSLEMPRGMVVSGKQRAVAEAGAFRAAAAAAVAAEGDSLKGAAAARAAAVGYSALGCMAASEHIKALAAMGAGGSSRLSRCT